MKTKLEQFSAAPSEYACTNMGFSQFTGESWQRPQHIIRLTGLRVLSS
ncbi:hypothetical protein [Bacillus haynesii]|nr:hypothetical protein [Bacillus haynesii]